LKDPYAPYTKTQALCPEENMEDGEKTAHHWNKRLADALAGVIEISPWARTGTPEFDVAKAVLDEWRKSRAANEEK
jgi:hypothetical protein